MSPSACSDQSPHIWPSCPHQSVWPFLVDCFPRLLDSCSAESPFLISIYPVVVSLLARCPSFVWNKSLELRRWYALSETHQPFSPFKSQTQAHLKLWGENSAWSSLGASYGLDSCLYFKSYCMLDYMALKQNMWSRTNSLWNLQTCALRKGGNKKCFVILHHILRKLFQRCKKRRFREIPRVNKHFSWCVDVTIQKPPSGLVCHRRVKMFTL